MDLDVNAERLLLWIILLPLFGAVINGIGGRFGPNRSPVSAVRVGSVAHSFVLAVWFFVRLGALRAATDEHENAAIVFDAFEWFSISLGDLRIPIHVRFVYDALAATMTLVVTGVGLLIHIYSAGYM